MALYDNKYWLLSHIRNSFISTDDTGMCELVMVGENLPEKLVEILDRYPDTDDSQEEDDDMEHESYDIQLDMEFSVRKYGNSMSAWLEKMDQKRRRAAKTKNIKWEPSNTRLTEEERNTLFISTENVKKAPTGLKKSLLSEQIKNCTNLPQNPFMAYAKFDGSAQVGIPVRKYKIFLTMLPEEQKNYPMIVVCIATAKIQELIGLICLKCSTVHGDFQLQPVTSYGLYITEEDGEVDGDFPCLDPKECVAKFGFTCLGLVEHRNSKVVTFESLEAANTESIEETLNYSSHNAMADETKQMTADLKLMEVHATAMEAPLYQSYRVYILTKMRSKVEIHLGISGEKIEIDPVQQKNTKFVLSRQKAVSHHMDSVAWCSTTSRSNKTTFRIIYISSSGSRDSGSGSFSSQSHINSKHYDFEADHATADEIVKKVNMILEIRSSLIRREFLATLERKQRRSFNLK